MNHKRESLRTNPWASTAADWAWGIAIGALLLAAGSSWSMARGDRRDVRAPTQATADEEGTDRVIVKYRNADRSQIDPTTQGSVRVAGNRAGVRLSRLRGMAHGGHVLRADRRLSLAAAQRLADDIRSGDAEVEYAEPDRIMTIQLVPNDPSYASQWNLFEATAGLNLPAAWDKSTGAGVVVAVLDTGVRPHVDLAGNLLAGYDFINDTTVANDGNGRDADAFDPGDWAAAGACGSGSAADSSSWHGTHVAGTIAALTHNARGVAGVAFGARVLPVRVLGRCGGYTSDIADGMVWAAGGSITGVPANPTPARVINLSLGGSGACGTTTQNAINSARSRGAVVVVAAGNSAANAAGFSPAGCAGVVTVAAVGRSGARASYSNYGTVVDVAAPGGDGSSGIQSTLNAGSSTPGADSYASYMGTSMATPHVAGVVALMLARNPALTPDEVEARLKSSAAARGFPVACSQCGSGLLDANRAIDAAIGSGTTTPAPTPAPAPTPTPAPTPSLTQVAEVESNHARSSAQAISANPAQVNATIGSTSDTDYFRVTLAAGRTLVATLAPNAGSDYDLYAYNAAGTRVASSVLGTGAVDTVSVRNAGTGATTVYVRVLRYSGGTGATGGRYTLKLAQ
ncbi:peptidase S8 and S53 subtilisin kexin sedolisin [Leptothrix cholodnii SP-6]|uniref:Peptidase S8 and S53 subtilisin kexin sedolisin n=1 Tax=Leptothrix cholodnii (strain ATCC 51168 / LMG 8142 / SP-6) TaxID=395495 RepID=B1XW89_LEPCP|nr:S8 family serine peptidase [Leptothrix cholodnii]ACB32616.1 peptidase S8 and S53 subtilisin kexin sedolisin [Leptothrix cholodnii SP-6]